MFSIFLCTQSDILDCLSWALRLTQVVSVIDWVPPGSSTRLLLFLGTLCVTLTLSHLFVPAKAVIAEALSSVLSTCILVSYEIKFQTSSFTTRLANLNCEKSLIILYLCWCTVLGRCGQHCCVPGQWTQLPDLCCADQHSNQSTSHPL